MICAHSISDGLLKMRDHVKDTPIYFRWATGKDDVACMNKWRIAVWLREYEYEHVDVGLDVGLEVGLRDADRDPVVRELAQLAFSAWHVSGTGPMYSTLWPSFMWDGSIREIGMGWGVVRAYHLEEKALWL